MWYVYRHNPRLDPFSRMKYVFRSDKFRAALHAARILHIKNNHSYFLTTCDYSKEKLRYATASPLCRQRR